MQKSDAVAAMGPSTVLLPAALAANDRLKLYLTDTRVHSGERAHRST